MREAQCSHDETKEHQAEQQDGHKKDETLHITHSLDTKESEKCEVCSLIAVLLIFYISLF